MQSNPVETFLHEADDLLADIEAAGLEMDRGRDGDEAVNRVFRAFHTIKGSGAMFGFDEVAGFTHHVETLLDLVREKTVPLSDELTSVILASVDHVRLLLHSALGGARADTDEETALLARVHRIMGPESAGLERSAGVRNDGVRKEEELPDTGIAAKPRLWEIIFRPDPSLLATGGNPVLLFRDLKKLGPCSVQGHDDRIPLPGDMQPEVCYLWWRICLTTTADFDTIRDVFLFVEDGSELRISKGIPPPAAPAAEPHLPAAGQHLPAAEPRLPAAATPSPDEEPRSLSPQVSQREATVRVPASRLDRLVNLVGELVMNQSRLATAAYAFRAPELDAPVEEIERLVAELRDDVLQIRMMPIGTIFARFRRLVRDLSLQLGKEIELVTAGEDTELDKSILDALGEPLVHLLRNSIDHGIESVADRLRKGKPRQGTIRLTASHRGSDVVVTIEDDGKGMDRAAIRSKAIARQLIAADANLTDKEVLNLILLPGFSTAETVTSLSGRGVGMDVVKRHIDALRGTLSVASEAGHGSCIPSRSR